MSYDSIVENGVTWNVVHANEKSLILNVPPSIDFPGEWSYGARNRVAIKLGQTADYGILQTKD